jgi:diguanylate cyclase (GGDEF)-like protein
MQNGIVFIINNGLERYHAVIDEYRKVSPFETVIIGLEDFLASTRESELRENGIIQSFLIIEASLFFEIEEKLTAYMKSTFEGGFSNYLLITGESASLAVQDSTLGRSPYHFLFSETADPALQATYLNLHMGLLMRNSIIGDRLTRYISDSFKVVVYSELINKKNSEIEILNKELELKSRIDNLTNLFNRNALYNFMEQERKRTTRDLWRLENSPVHVRDRISTEPAKRFPSAPLGSIDEHFGYFSIMMIDLDDFKRVNDSFGHLVGDDVLRGFGGMFKDGHILRENDVAGRFGGEEFIVILPETNADNALGVAQRLSDRFSRISFTAGDGTPFNVTVSIGISEYHPEDKSCEDIITRADKAMYIAKEEGRNRIVIHERIQNRQQRSS